MEVAWPPLNPVNTRLPEARQLPAWAPSQGVQAHIRVSTGGPGALLPACRAG
jgi:hypothetical protein